jgi:hypothetical protein
MGDGVPTRASVVRGRDWIGAAAPSATAVRGVANAVALARPAFDGGGGATGAFMPISSGRGPATRGEASVRPLPPTPGDATTRPLLLPPTPGDATTRPPPGVCGTVRSWIPTYVGPERITYVEKPGW